MVHFSGFARKMNHLSSFYASKASAKMPFNAYFEFMYGFKFLLKIWALPKFLTKKTARSIRISTRRYSAFL
ncbi:MAG: hypothetical protein U5L45_16160 [Saprospiraceae bacterium]|nr:hypothetical protein [Saprospiraceae bacterium]